MAEGKRKLLYEKGKHLHRLIRSLTPGQNVGFRPQLPPVRKLLYDVLRKMEDYDEAGVVAAFPEHSIQALQRIKSVLMDEVIKYAVEFAPHNGRRDLYRLLVEAKHLREIAMEQIALMRIEHAIRLATDMEAVAELHEAIKVRRKLIGAIDPSKRDDGHLLELEMWALKGGEETAKFDHLEAVMYRLSLLPTLKVFSQVGDLEKELDSVPFPSLIRNQIQFYNLRHFIFRQYGETSKCLDAAESINSLAEKHPQVLSDADVREVFFYSITFLATAAAEAKKFGEVEMYLGRIKALAKEWGGGLEANPSLNARYIFTKLALSIAMKDWKSAHEQAKRAFDDVVKRNILNGVSTQAAVLRIATIAAFINQDYRLTRRLAINLREHLTYSSNTKVVLARSIAFVSLILLLTYYEEGDSYLQFAAKDLGKWIQGSGTLGPYETAVLTFFKKTGENPTGQLARSSLIAFKDELEQLFKLPQLVRYKAMFPLHLWIDAKLSGRDLRSFELV